MRPRRAPSLFPAALALTPVLVFGASACDEPSSQPPPSDPPPVEAPAPPTPEPVPEAEPEPDPEPPKPVGGPHCDQREAKGSCIDFTAHTGASEIRCFEGVELAEGPCPEEGVVATCTLTATGVALRYYEGAELDAIETTCATIDGKLESPSQ